MRGHEQLIATRRGGLQPVSVQIALTDLPLPKWCSVNPGAHAWLHIGSGDTIERLDLRCLVGMLVVIDGHDEQRVESVHSAAISHGARRVVSTVTEPKFFDVVKTIDSARQ